MAQTLPNTPDGLAGFDLTADQREIRDAAERFFIDTLQPLGRRMDDEEWFPSEMMPRLAGTTRKDCLPFRYTGRMFRTVMIRAFLLMYRRN